MADNFHGYFELTWAILSTIGLNNFLLGFLILSIIGSCPIAAVPIIVSAAGAVANGLCVVAFYSTYPIHGRIIAAAIADICWLVGLPC